MNERIRELAKQSGIWFVTDREDLLNDFANLIISEVEKHILKHFGIEE